MDKIKKILIICILIIVGFFAVYGSINIFSKFNTKSGLTIFSQNENNNPNSSYSFVADDDNDGLSNAKEIVYSSDPKNPDTDHDSYPDGHEVENGYDPLVIGKRLSDRTTQNLTIKYFSWVKEKYNINDPILQDSSIKEYLNIYYPVTSVLPDIAENKLIVNRNADSQDTINYIESLNNIELPQGFLNYNELYEKMLAGQTVDIDSILNELNANADKLYKMAAPEKAIEIHKKYIGIMEMLKIIFADLKNTRKDPVLIKLNIKKGQELAKIAESLEKEKNELLTITPMLIFATANATDKPTEKDGDKSILLELNTGFAAVTNTFFAKIGSELEKHTPSQPNPKIGEECGGNTKTSAYPPGYTLSTPKCDTCPTCIPLSCRCACGACPPSQTAYLWDSVTKICGCGE